MKDQIRQTQMVMSFGPGAMIDLPDSSVLVAGLEYWSYEGKELQAALVHEPRLVARLAARFGSRDLQLRKPPRADEDPAKYTSAVGAWRFPRWYVAANERKTKEGYVERRLVHRRELVHGKFMDGGKGVPIVPVRFVRACPRGHIDDIDWAYLIHGPGKECLRPRWMVERGNAGDLEEVVMRCECGAQVRMSQAADRSRRLLGMCDGARPWLGPRSREKCGVPSQLLIRSASNAYFPERQTVISIPPSTGSADERVRQVVLKLDEIASEREGLRFLRKAEPLKSTLEGLLDADVWAAYDRAKSGASLPVRSVKDEEFEALTRAPDSMGADEPEGTFYARTLPRTQWDAPWMEHVKRVVLVHRLRSVTALLGFTRFESSSADINGELDAEVKTAALAREASWLPASEMHGEGIFLQFDAEAIGRWTRSREAQARLESLLAGHEAWCKEHEGAQRKFAGLPYIMLHSLAHLLQTAISLECGYAAASLQERVYAIQEGDRTGLFGLLIYTAGTDAQGTLGGLVDAGRAISRHMRHALEGARLCSNDPVCAQHDHKAPGAAHLNGAACHGCLLVGETSCEQRNDFLDRALVVPTVEASGAAFFKDLI